MGSLCRLAKSIRVGNHGIIGNRKNEMDLHSEKGGLVIILENHYKLCS